MNKTQTVKVTQSNTFNNVNTTGVKTQNLYKLLTVNNPESNALMNKRYFSNKTKQTMGNEQNNVPYQQQGYGVDLCVSNQGYYSQVTKDNADNKLVVFQKRHSLIRTRELKTKQETTEQQTTEQSKSQNKKQEYVKIKMCPYGLYFKAVFDNDQWQLFSPNSGHLNDERFGTQHTVMDVFKQLLQKENLSLDDLNKQTTYGFVMGSNNFSVFKLKHEYLVVDSFYNKNIKGLKTWETEDNVVKTLLHFPKKKINLDNKFLQKKENVCNGLLYKNDIPVLYITVDTKNNHYQYETQLFELMWQVYKKTKQGKSLEDYRVTFQKVLDQQSKKQKVNLLTKYLTQSNL